MRILQFTIYNFTTILQFTTNLQLITTNSKNNSIKIKIKMKLKLKLKIFRTNDGKNRNKCLEQRKKDMEKKEGYEGL